MAVFVLVHGAWHGAWGGSGCCLCWSNGGTECWHPICRGWGATRRRWRQSLSMGGRGSSPIWSAGKPNRSCSSAIVVEAWSPAKRPILFSIASPSSSTWRRGPGVTRGRAGSALADGDLGDAACLERGQVRTSAAHLCRMPSRSGDPSGAPAIDGGRHAVPVVSMDTDHSPFYSAPDQLAMALASIAAGTLDCSCGRRLGAYGAVTLTLTCWRYFVSSQPCVHHPALKLDAWRRRFPPPRR
jgi:hypothetical protein